VYTHLHSHSLFNYTSECNKQQFPITNLEFLLHSSSLHTIWYNVMWCDVKEVLSADPQLKQIQPKATQPHQVIHSKSIQSPKSSCTSCQLHSNTLPQQKVPTQLNSAQLNSTLLNSTQTNTTTDSNSITTRYLILLYIRHLLMCASIYYVLECDYSIECTLTHLIPRIACITLNSNGDTKYLCCASQRVYT
jgi:hypothetical protein